MEILDGLRLVEKEKELETTFIRVAFYCINYGLQIFDGVEVYNIVKKLSRIAFNPSL